MKYLAPVPFAFALLSAIGCGQSKPDKPGPDLDAAIPDAYIDEATTDANVGTVNIGFNAKGSLNTPEQVEYTAKMLKTMSAKNIARMHIRVNGGTVSQLVKPSDWPDDMLTRWVDLQKAYGFGFVYVVNGNDTPQSQLGEIQRWRSKGAKFTFLEMMNEYYLPKYEKGPTATDAPPEVTRVVTSDIYFNEIVPTYEAALNAARLPYFLIAAPVKNATGVAWNDSLKKYVQAHSDRGYGVTVHLYDSGSGPYDYDQILALRGKLPAGTPIAVTESGITDPNIQDYAAMGARTKFHLKQLTARLAPRDHLFDPILYSDYKDFSATLNPREGGITPKGVKVLEYMAELP
jgi:hypothetical protein